MFRVSNKYKFIKFQFLWLKMFFFASITMIFNYLILYIMNGLEVFWYEYWYYLYIIWVLVQIILIVCYVLWVIFTTIWLIKEKPKYLWIILWIFIWIFWIILFAIDWFTVMKYYSEYVIITNSLKLFPFFLYIGLKNSYIDKFILQQSRNNKKF